MKITPLLFAATMTVPLLSHQAHAQGKLKLSPISTVRNGVAADLFDQSAAEIVKFDSKSKKMFVVNGAMNSVDVFNATNPASPVFVQSIDLSRYGNPNSLDVSPSSNEIAVAVGNDDKTKRGSVVFLSKKGDLIKSVKVGFLPDMLTYNAQGTKVVVANEGEPNDDYSVDPEGSVSIIDIDGGTYTHHEITFSDLKKSDVPGVRISGPKGTTVAQDLEPEFVSIEGKFAYVTCQENSAVAKINMETRKLVRIMALGTINHAEIGYGIDASDEDGMIRIANWPVRGQFMPDGIATYTAKSGDKTATYFVTANEGDSREYGDYLDESRVEDLALDPSAFPLGDTLKLPENLGRLKVVNTAGDLDGDGDFDQLFSYGTRSFSIFDSMGKLVFDSGSMIEIHLANKFPDEFNSAHDESGSFDARSDDKGAEPEAIELGVIGGRTYAFVGLERFSGIMVYDITNPRNVTQAGFTLNRDFSVEFNEDDLSKFGKAGDLGPEGLDFVSAKDSPTGKPLLVVANEVSGTTTIYQIN